MTEARQSETKTLPTSLPPPSLHMHLGRGLSSLAKSRHRFLLFDSQEEENDEEVQTALSESDLLSLFELPISNDGASSSSSNQTMNSRSMEDPKQNSRKRQLESV
jgi:hypothetical protein